LKSIKILFINGYFAIQWFVKNNVGYIFQIFDFLEEDANMKKRNLLGILIIAVGVVILLGRLEIIDSAYIFGTYWPLILIAIGSLNLSDKYGSKTLASVLIIIGVIFQLKELNLEILEGINVGEFILPSVIIIIGVWLIFSKKKGTNTKVYSDSTLDNFCLFSGSDIINDSSDFQGGNLGAAFGGIDVNLRDANIIGTEPIMIDAFVAFGGIDIKVPMDWKVEIRGIPLFGGWSNKTKRENVNTNKVLIVKCLVLFGGLDVKH
jgi:predicted membrane protein